MRLPKRLRPCEALPRLAAVMAGYLGRSPAAARYPPMAWIPIAAIPLGSSRAPSAPHILVELREIRRPALGAGGERLLGLGARQPRRKFPAFAVPLIGYRKRPLPERLGCGDRRPRLEIGRESCRAREGQYG